ncbi:MAG: hypothetical protein RQ842_07080 [Vulcanisaeta sp.]|nr:hypothetical protein [Vulcanisaeta sp.]
MGALELIGRWIEELTPYAESLPRISRYRLYRAFSASCKPEGVGREGSLYLMCRDMERAYFVAVPGGLWRLFWRLRYGDLGRGMEFALRHSYTNFVISPITVFAFATIPLNVGRWLGDLHVVRAEPGRIELEVLLRGAEEGVGGGACAVLGMVKAVCLRRRRDGAQCFRGSSYFSTIPITPPPGCAINDLYEEVGCRPVCRPDVEYLSRAALAAVLSSDVVTAFGKYVEGVAELLHRVVGHGR